MGDKATLVKARQELEDLYLGVADDSVNLTFKDFVSLQQNGAAERKNNNLDSIKESSCFKKQEGSSLGKSPSLDFVKGLQGVKTKREVNDHFYVEDEIYGESSTPIRNKTIRSMDDNSFAYDDLSIVNRTSISPYNNAGGYRRPGIPHTNICTICSLYIYIFRHRCLVCGRVYCRQCVSMGMGEMTEGRKCIECLGRRFSQRYIKRAGHIGCCGRYPSKVKQQELKWAEKGPRRSGEGRSGQSGMASRSRSPVVPRTPTRAHVSSPPSFVMSSPISLHHAMPF